MSDIRKRVGSKGTTYQVRYPSTKTKSGYAYATFNTMKEARAFRGNLSPQQIGPIDPSIRTVNEVIMRWLEICEKEGRDGRDPCTLYTIKTYENRADIMRAYGWEKELAELQTPDIVAFRSWLLRNYSRDQALSSFNSVLKEMALRGHIISNFDSLLADAEGANRALRFERATGHLPDTMDEAVPHMRLLIRQHHAAMLDANVEQVMALREEAHKLALRLNKGEPGIIAHNDAPGCALARATAAAPEIVPQWGQTGDFVVTVDDMAVRIEMDGFFGIGGTFLYWPGFAVRAVSYDRPFLSETGYRSFLGIHADPEPGLTPDEFVAKVIAAHVERELKGKLLAIDPRYGKSEAAP